MIFCPRCKRRSGGATMTKISRCRHLRGDLYREIQVWGMWHFEAGVPTGDGWSGDGDMTGRLRFVCEDCGLDKIYSYARWPKWLHARFEMKMEEAHDSGECRRATLQRL